MGCGGSKNEVDFGQLDEARNLKEKEIRNSADGTAAGGGAAAAAAAPTTGNFTESIYSQNGKSFQKPTPPPVTKDILSTVTPALQNLAAGPSLVTQVKATTAVVLNKTTATTAKGAHHLKNVFATPIGSEDIAAFQAPIFPKDQDEKKFIRESLKKNFVFAALSEREIRTIIDAFEDVIVKASEVLIQQGDVGDYFYIMRSGKVRFEVNKETVGNATTGDSFGELALLYTSPRAASAIAETNTEVYRVDQKTFRYILQSQTLQTESDKKALLEGVSFLQGLDPTDINKLVHTMTPRVFEAGEYLVRKGEDGDTFFVIQEGKVKVTDITIGSTDYEDQTLGPGDYFGERALVTKEPRSANCICASKGIVLTIDNQTFTRALGNMDALTTKSEDRRKLAAIKLFQMTNLSLPTLTSLAEHFVQKTIPPHTTIFTQTEPTQAALYLVRRGNVRIYCDSGEVDNIVDAGGYFGEDLLEIDVNKSQRNNNNNNNMKQKYPKSKMDSRDNKATPKYNAMTLSGEVVVAVLTIDELRNLIDTTQLGHPKKQEDFLPEDEASDIPLVRLKKHAILGAGTFGQVWLVSYEGPTSKIRRPYALKIQSKYELVSNHQARGVVQEKRLMAQMNHPFLIRLVQTYQDKQYVYMLLGLVQGGELFSLIHQASYDGISEKDAKFYAAGILEGLSHLHRRHILYRDLKPENVLIDAQGYPVIVDFGFAKYVSGKTYTLCGTPLYLAPEVILNRGHDKGADHWSYAVLLFEMIAGYTPFYTEGMDQVTLFRSICKGEYQFPPAGVTSMEAEDLLQRFFIVDPSRRLGSLARGVNEIYAHTWYSDIDFAELRHKVIEAPWVPQLNDPLDKSNFENWDHLEDKTLKKDPPISNEAQNIFIDF